MAENWCDRLAAELLEAWPYIESESGVLAQNEQSEEAGQQHAKEIIAGIVERAWNRSIEDAVPVNMDDCADGAKQYERERILQLMRERIAWLESARVTPAASAHVRCSELEQMIRRIEE